MIIWIV